MLKVTNKKGAALLSEYQYGYDANGNIVSVTDATGTTSYQYDKLDRLTQVKRPSGQTIVYAYDARGNRKTLQGDSLIEDTKEQNYTFNVWDQLKIVTQANVTTEFEYEMQGLRLSKTTTTTGPADASGQTPSPVTEKVRYAYNNSGKVITEASANNQALANYVWGPDRLLAKRDASTNKKYYYVYNGHGDVVQIVDEAGNTVNRYQYDEWGNILQQEEQIRNAFKYAGEMQDEATGLYYLRARYYDPAVGRFISKDTYEGSVTNPLSLNLYTYVENNPIIYTDPSGNWCTATVNGKLYSHPGKCSGSGNGQDYIPDSNATNFGRTIVDAGVNKGKWYPDNTVHIKADPTGITDAVIGCAYDSQCSGFVSGAISEVPAAYNGAKSAVSKTIDTVKGIFGGGTKGKTDVPKQVVTSNKGNNYNVTQSSNHNIVTKNPGPTGQPNSSIDIVDPKTGELLTRRWYGPDGRATRDIDYTHHKNPKTHPEAPHEHSWKYDKYGNPSRSK